MALWKRSGNRIERRRESRLTPDAVVAHYWTGGRSSPRPVRELGFYGAAIAAPDMYYPGTVIRISLEDTNAAEAAGEASRHAGVWGKVIRNTAGGFCVVFVFENRAERMHFRRFLEQLRRKAGR